MALFNDLEINPEILRAVEDMQFEEMTPIQEKAIPVLMQGKDCIGQAQTGTGKTAAFGIPLLDKVGAGVRSPQAIILCPTRELALQISTELHNLAKYMHGIRILPIYGGADMQKQIRALKGGVQIIVGTPGRVMDHLRRKTIKCDYVQTVMLDEADEMLNMGFREDIETVLGYISEDHQTVLFSATMPKEILEIAKQYQKEDKVTVKITPKELTVKNIEQYYYDIRRMDKMDVLVRLLNVYDPKKSLVFCNTKKRTDEVAESLKSMGFMADALHGDLFQQKRDQVMNGFRSGKTSILVATDVAARGIDVDNVEAVFNYDIPQDNEYYVHRIGRTGRAGKSGKAFSLIKRKEIKKLRDIAHYCKTHIEEMPIPSEKDVMESRLDRVMLEVIDILENKNLDSTKAMIKNLIADGAYKKIDIAAALLYRALEEEKEKQSENNKELYVDRSTFANTGATEPGMVRFFINVGKKDRIRPGDLVGAIAGEAHIPGSSVGEIALYDTYSFVEISEEYAMKVYQALQKSKEVKIKGRIVNIEPANQ